MDTGCWDQTSPPSPRKAQSGCIWHGVCVCLCVRACVYACVCILHMVVASTASSSSTDGHVSDWFP